MSIIGGSSNAAPLDTLRPEHPRLLVLDGDLPGIRALIKSNPKAGKFYDKLIARASGMLAAPPDQYKIGGAEHTLLTTSRDMEDRMLTLAGLYRLTGDKRYAERARLEMLAAASFPDWNPKHMLDTAEMTAGMAIGYDWLYHYLSAKDEDTIRGAIWEKGLAPGIQAMAKGGTVAQRDNNWVQVCAGGFSLGALAIAGQSKKKAAQAISLGQEQITRIMKKFAPDGGFEEGPMYWNYATTYNVLYLAAVNTALGTDWNQSGAPGFQDTGNYRMHAVSPLGKYANFGDCNEDINDASEMLWMAKRFNRPNYALDEEEIGNADLNNRFAILDLLWFLPVSGTLGDTKMPLGEKFERVNLAFMRSAWGDPNATYVAFKGGSAKASHGHLDLGSFILEAFGERWGVALGADSYGLPGYFKGQRWNYYRTGTAGQNTLSINNQNEDLDGEAPITTFHAPTPGGPGYAVANLSAYKKLLTFWRRGIAMLDAQRVIVQDEFQPKAPADITWNFHTRANVAISSGGTVATLTQGKATMIATILLPANVRFTTKAAQGSAIEEPNPGVTNLTISYKAAATPQAIIVMFSSPAKSMPLPQLVKMESWTKLVSGTGSQ